jgi:hypothetical protein
LDDGSIDRFSVQKIAHPNTYQTDDEYGYGVHDGTLLSLWSNGFPQSISIFTPRTGRAPSAEPGEWPPILSVLEKNSMNNQADPSSMALRMFHQLCMKIERYRNIMTDVELLLQH